METFKMGKLPAVHTLRTMRTALAMAAILDTLGTPPPSSNNYIGKAISTPCNVYGNNTSGDCVEVDTAYGLIIRTANVGPPVVPTITDVLALYRVFGYNPEAGIDPGTSELAMCQYLKNVGFMGHRLNNYGTIDPGNVDHVKWCIQWFGSCRVGWRLPRYAQQQFNYNEPWAVQRGDQTIAGGHDTLLVHYEGDTFFTSTWGRWMQPVTRLFVTTFCEEAHPELAFDWIQAQGVSPSGFSLNDLELKLQEAAA
jgi:hypothetical protein